MFILKSTHNKVVSELRADILKQTTQIARAYRLGWDDAIASMKVQNVVKVPVKSATKVNLSVDPKAQAKLEKRSRKLRLQQMKRYYYSKVRGKIDNGYCRIENGVRISNVTGKPLRKLNRTHKKTKLLPF